MKRKHTVFEVDVRDRESGAYKMYTEFYHQYEKGKLESAERTLDDLFEYSYQNNDVYAYELLALDAALKGEKGQILKAIRLNRNLLDALRSHNDVTDLEVIASENLIKDLKSFGYNVGAISEEAIMSERCYKHFNSTRSNN